jgi:radical SAM protein with 4Fe4S-binding SPASM domain
MNNIRKAFSLARNGQFDHVLQKVMCRLGVINFFVSNPIIINIEPTNACNLRCPTCPAGSGLMNRPKRMMRFDEFKGIVDQVRGYVEKVILFNLGEPFLNKDLLQMIRYAVDSGLYIETSTNGELFKSREFCNDVVQSRLQKLIVCLDGANQETLTKFRKGSEFERIINGIQSMVDAKKDFESNTPEIEFQFIVMKHNEHQKTYMKELAARLGVDIYCEKTIGIDCSDPNFQELAKDLLPSDLSRSRYVLTKDGDFALKGEIPNYCSRIFHSAVINSDGSVVPCCYDLYSNHVMGNIFEESLEKIWRNRRYRTFRRKMLKDRKSIPMCNICSEGRSEIRKRDDLT